MPLYQYTKRFLFFPTYKIDLIAEILSEDLESVSTFKACIPLQEKGMEEIFKNGIPCSSQMKPMGDRIGLEKKRAIHLLFLPRIFKLSYTNSTNG